MYKEILDKLFDENSPNTEMTEVETRIFMQIIMSNENDLKIDINDVNKESETYIKLKELLEAFQIQVFLKRLELLTTLKMTLGGLMILSQYFENVAQVVMYTYYLKYKLPENTLVSADVIASELFPIGFFSTEQLNVIWDGQKVKKDKHDVTKLTLIGAPDNLIDYKEVWEN